MRVTCTSSCDDVNLFQTCVNDVGAVYQATKIFVSNLNAKLAQRFLALVLLPRVRQDIKANKRLHFALFQALKKATYKPGAFYKASEIPPIFMAVVFCVSC